MQANRIFTILSIFLITLVGLLGAAYATDLTWNTASTGEWDNAGGTQNNWFGGVAGQFPQDGDSAAQDASFSSRIDVDSDERCDNFTGDGDSPTDRHLRIKAGAELTIDVDMSNAVNTGNYAVRVEDGTGASNFTKLIAGGVDGIDVSAARGNNALWVAVNVTDDVIDSTISLGAHSDVDIGGNFDGVSGGGHELTATHSGDIDIVGDLVDVKVTLGASSLGIGETPTTVTIGSVGDPTLTHEDWTLLGAVDVEIDDSGTGSGNFLASSDVNDVMDVRGDSTVTIDNGVRRGKWTVQDTAAVIAFNAEFGDWTVQDTATMNIMEHFTPTALTVDGTTVDAKHLGQIPGSPSIQFPWNMTIKNGGTSTTTSGGNRIADSKTYFPATVMGRTPIRLLPTTARETRS